MLVGGRAGLSRGLMQSSSPSSPHGSLTVKTKEMGVQGQPLSGIECLLILVCGDFSVQSFHRGEHNEGKVKTGIQLFRFAAGMLE